MMMVTTLRQNVIVKPEAIWPSFPAFQRAGDVFLLHSPLSKLHTRFGHLTNQTTDGSPGEDHAVRENIRDILVRLPSLKASKWKVRVLQDWVGDVVQVSTTGFLARVADRSNPKNAPEEVDLAFDEVSPSDLPLVREGARFYWSIGYCDTPEGQRERVSALRFARVPRLSQAFTKRVLADADRTAILLESD
jgi:hypothetical protein